MLGTGSEKGLPGIRVQVSRGIFLVVVSEILANRVTFIAVNSPLSLLKVDGIWRQVPVDDCMAIPVEIKPFLTDGGRHQYERPKR